MADLKTLRNLINGQQFEATFSSKTLNSLKDIEYLPREDREYNVHFVFSSKFETTTIKVAFQEFPTFNWSEEKAIKWKEATEKEVNDWIKIIKFLKNGELEKDSVEEKGKRTIKKYEVRIDREYLVEIYANSEQEAEEYVQTYLGNLVDESTPKDQEEKNFKISDMELLWSEVLDCQESEKKREIKRNRYIR